MEKELETRYHAEEGKIYTSVDGSKFRIGKADVDFLTQLQNLNPLHRVELMFLTETEMLDVIATMKKIKVDEIIGYFKTKWLWKETGDEARVEYIIPLIPSDKCNPKGFKKYSKKLSINELNEIINAFVGDNSEIYTIPPKELI